MRRVNFRLECFQMGLSEMFFLCFITVLLLNRVLSYTDPADFSAVSVVRSNWKNLPPSWKGIDPCGKKWEGIGCRNSRITSIQLSGVGLVGTLSGDISLLTELQTLDLSQNKNLTGTLPSAIGKLVNLQILMLVGCNFNGLIPDTIGSMNQLVYLSLASNNFEGQIPSSFGNLSNVLMLDFTDNNLSGPIPVSNGTSPGLDWLVNAKHFHFSKNQLSGPIPPRLYNSSSQLVHMLFDNNQLSGNVPTTIDHLQHLEVLRLDKNDFSGSIALNFSKLTNISELYLANNNFTGPIPNLTGMKYLNVLDLSNNSFDPSPVPNWVSNLRTLRSLMMQSTQLQGFIPITIFSIPSLQSIVMSDNSLNGTLNLSNNFSKQLQLIDLQNNSITRTEEHGYTNSLLLQGNPFCSTSGSTTSVCKVESLRSSYTTQTKNCVKPICSSPKISSPNCKCGDPIVGILHFRSVPSSNAKNGSYYSSFEGAILRAFQADKLPVDSVSLRIPESDLDDYIFVRLEIFPLEDDRFNRTAFSLITYQLNNITFIKLPTYFGPYYYTLISINYFEENAKSFHAVIVIIPIACGSALILLLSLSFLFFVLQRRRAKQAIHKYDPFASWDKKQGSESRPEIKEVKFFTFEQIRKFTNDFSTNYLIGDGGYGKVYRGKLPNGMLIAIKRSNKISKHIITEFKTEIELLSRIHHRNLVNLCGICYDKGETMLIYEYIPNGTLKDAITGVSGIHLDWERRLMIALDSARGLAYLHELVDPPIIHMDVKSNNILLDEQMVAKVSDFGLSKLVNGIESTEVSGLKGTIGYLDPEYCITNRATEKSDVYSFGVVMLEMVTGKAPIQSKKHIVSEVRMLIDKPEGFYDIKELVDCRIRSCNCFGIERYLNLALRCVADERESRPTMGEVVKEIESIIQSGDLPKKKDVKILSNANIWSSKESSVQDWKSRSSYSGSFPGTETWMQIHYDSPPAINRRSMSMPLIYTY